MAHFALPTSVMVHATLVIGDCHLMIHTLTAFDKAPARVTSPQFGRDCPQFGCEEALTAKLNPCEALEMAFADLHKLIGITTANAGKAVAILKALELGEIAKKFGKMKPRRKEMVHPVIHCSNHRGFPK